MRGDKTNEITRKKTIVEQYIANQDGKRHDIRCQNKLFGICPKYQRKTFFIYSYSSICSEYQFQCEKSIKPLRDK